MRMRNKTYILISRIYHPVLCFRRISSRWNPRPGTRSWVFVSVYHKSLVDDRIRRIRLCVSLVSFVVKRIRLHFLLCTSVFSLCEPHLDSKHSTQQQLRRTQRKSYLDHASRASSHFLGKTNRIRVLNTEPRKGSDQNLYRVRPFLYCGNTCTSEGGCLG